MKRSTIIAVGALTCGIIAVPMAASAANGGSWLLGRVNAETAATTVTNTAGTPLTLNSRAGYAPLAVNSSTKVGRFNADLLDGLDSTSFLRTTGKAADSAKLGGRPASDYALSSQLPAPGAGRTGTIVDPNVWDTAGPVCPAGSVATGGGSLYTTYPPQYSGPDWNYTTAGTRVPIPNSWINVASDQIYPAFVTCYNPAGAVPGAATSLPDLTGDPLNQATDTTDWYNDCMAMNSSEPNVDEICAQYLPDPSRPKMPRVWMKPNAPAPSTQTARSNR